MHDFCPCSTGSEEPESVIEIRFRWELRSVVESFENEAVVKNDTSKKLASEILRNQFAETLASRTHPSYTPEQLVAFGDQVLTVLDPDGDGHSRFSIVTAPDKSVLDSHEAAGQTMRRLEAQAGRSLSWLGRSGDKAGTIDVEIIGNGAAGDKVRTGTYFSAPVENLVSTEADKILPRAQLASGSVNGDSPEDCRKLLTDYLGLDIGASQEELNHRLAARSRQLPDDTTPEELLEVFKRERLSNHFNTRRMDSRGLSLEQMQLLVADDAKNAIAPDTADGAAEGISDVMHGAEGFYGLPPGSSASDLQRIMYARDAAIAGLPASTSREIVEQALDNLYGVRRDRELYLRGIGLSNQADMEGLSNLRRDKLLEAGYPAEMADTEEGIAVLDALARREQSARLRLPEDFDVSVFPSENADGKAQDRKQTARLLGLPEDVSSSDLDSAAANTFGQCAASVEDLVSGRFIEFPGGE